MGVTVTASALSHISIVLAVHGDAVIFGACNSKGSGAVSDPRFFSPSRVRRTDAAIAKRKSSASKQQDEEWEKQRGSAISSPLVTVGVGAGEAFGVDRIGSLWVWSLVSSRPCFADSVSIRPSSGGHVALASVTVAERLGVIWALDATQQRNLWKLNRKKDETAGEVWQAERSELLAQALQVCCGSEHHSVIVSLQRPPEVLGLSKSRSRVGSEGSELMPPQSPALAPLQDSFLSQPAGYEPWSDNAPESFAFPGGFSGVLHGILEAGQPRQKTTGPPSLQQICEDKLCRSLDPRSFGMLCEVAWEFNRPHLLDRAFAFLNSNAALMFSRQYLPILAQLPREVLIALELRAAGKVCSCSEALRGIFCGGEGPWEELVANAEPMPVDVETTAGGGASTGNNTGAAGETGSSKRSKRRGGGTGSPVVASIPGASPALVADSRSPKIGAMAPLPKLGSSAQPRSPPACLLRSGRDEDWVAVRHSKKIAAQGKSGGQVIGLPSSPSAAAKPLPSPKLGFAAATAKSPSGAMKSPPKPTSDNPDSVLTQQLPLSTFVKPGRSALKASGSSQPSSGPSAMLTAAVASVKPGWAMPATVAEGPANLREILATEKDSKQRDRGGSLDAGASSSKKAATTRKSSEEATKCSWGFDAMPSEQPKGKSIFELQKQEADEQERLKEEADIREIEAMFAALEVAEMQEEYEFLHPHEEANDKSSSNGGKSAGKKGRAKGDAAKGKGRGKGKGVKRFAGSSKSSQQDEHDGEEKNTAGSCQNADVGGKWEDSSWGWKDSWWSTDSWKSSSDHLGHARRGGGQKRENHKTRERAQRWSQKSSGNERDVQTSDTPQPE
eukprot:TRINITY_DN19922_c0_g1_i2.p1 TRINITY_DN19922_c0_g1~~TRINITY_DN19922_c0_g1_i2.p1  ORF type:complete len:842 (+),score=205.10 TRINITY_DN19922_c0_g1_i2:1079-3604(+)